SVDGEGPVGHGAQPRDAPAARLIGYPPRPVCAAPGARHEVGRLPRVEAGYFDHSAGALPRSFGGNNPAVAQRDCSRLHLDIAGGATNDRVVDPQRWRRDENVARVAAAARGDSARDIAE